MHWYITYVCDMREKCNITIENQNERYYAKSDNNIR